VAPDAGGADADAFDAQGGGATDAGAQDSSGAAEDTAPGALDAGADAVDAGGDGGTDAGQQPDAEPSDAEPNLPGDAAATDTTPGGSQPDAQPHDAGSALPDTLTDAAAELDAALPADCEEGGAAGFDYTCSAGDPATCPEGLCILGQCIGPVLDPQRWEDCGDGECAPCELGGVCPADCQAPPVLPAKDHHAEDTITIWVHGFRNVSPSEFEEMVYGDLDGCGGTLSDLEDFGVYRPCAEDPILGNAPNHYAKVEYFGAQPADWMTPEDIAEVEQYDWKTAAALQRYGLIVAKFIRHRLALSGASWVNLACHSMGCLVLRYAIENDLESLASDGVYTRWSTSAGVIAGARLARLYDNPSVQEVAQAIGFNLSEFVFMNPDYVQDFAAAWDHQLYQGNSPYLRDIYIHHHTGTDPRVSDALNVQLLDLDNPADEPNDGIMFTLDQYFHAQGPLAGVEMADSTVLQAGRTAFYMDHTRLPETQSFALLTAATLFHDRRVQVRLVELELFDDKESAGLFDGQTGTAPAELCPHMTVRYTPSVGPASDQSIVVHETSRAHRSAEVFSASEGGVVEPGTLLFDGPVLDEMQTVRLELSLREVDWYPRFGVFEWALDADEAVLDWAQDVELKDADIEVVQPAARLLLRVRVYSL
jgi:hypothetical protein